MTRTAREAQRKMNHSLIEKARRGKINDALEALKALVPSDEPDDDGGTRDFKLEVLVRTVRHLRELTARVEAYEAGACPGCGGRRSAKRKREEVKETSPHGKRTRSSTRASKTRAAQATAAMMHDDLEVIDLESGDYEPEQEEEPEPSKNRRYRSCFNRES